MKKMLPLLFLFLLLSGIIFLCQGKADASTIQNCPIVFAFSPDDDSNAPISSVNRTESHLAFYDILFSQGKVLLYTRGQKKNYQEPSVWLGILYLTSAGLDQSEANHVCNISENGCFPREILLCNVIPARAGPYL